MSTLTDWIWQQPAWPHFTWQVDRLPALLRACSKAQGQLLGMIGAAGADASAQTELDALLQNIITSSAIEGEQLNAGSVRSSLARRLGLAGDQRVSQRSEGLAELMLDATQQHHSPLTLERLLHWHRLLFTVEDAYLAHGIRIGALRGDEPMQVVSGRLDRPTVHFQAPPREGLDTQLADFLNWFDRSRSDTSLDPFLRAGIAHFWFVTLHPFDDGNGRLARTITDLALAQSENQAIRFYALSASILAARQGYYRILEDSQKAEMDITPWLEWFLQTLLDTLEQAIKRIDRVLAKARYWQQHRAHGLSVEQVKVLNRLLDGDVLSDKNGFEAGISAAQYQAVAKVSKATATRHLSDLVEKGCLQKLPGGGRSTRYEIDGRL
ncbi:MULTISPECIES: Fic family protein [unclassified Pseudomonas]|uniref:Fic family protein n=1 Tax=unclassified Pseudomonas TaxID=196821 RepID=UPI002AC8C3B2|nr:MULTISPECIES: Fic family protein [unclassified Pseudomonas]MEB0039404.1 Fic family protein [Pseudomonas sp. MH10]MEB0079290.1 Fic family protein [Pseudomonas sp. MH10out]MEB0092597.1 Fic family protein [Pseudomonas sp. CCI4.2]MEB0102563.1 Fic family protein [Pseudomonas sp. CCI3.2]MEB0119155.1 Fic family protein [Pseudomonas sp. CCI1.2]